MKNPLIARFAGAAIAALIAPEMNTQFETCLQQAHEMMQTADHREAVRLDTGDFWTFEPDSYMARMRPYVVKDGVLQIPVRGVLLHNFPYAMGDWATGYDYIWRAFERGMGDLNVKGVALVVDSCGGMVAGCFEAVNKMWALKGVKPVRGYAAENAYSAAYAIISVADTISVTETGGVGSIGVVTSHVDVSGAMEKYGEKITFIFAGAHKVDGNPYEALPKDVKARIQSRINKLYDVFVSTVARNRGMDEQAVRDTEALTFPSDEALSNGLADSIGSLDDSLADYAADLTPTPDDGEDDMSAQNGAVDQAAHDAAIAAARAEGLAAGIAQGADTGAKAAQDRIKAVLASDEAKDRPIAANNVAMNTSMSLDDAKVFLAAMPKEAAVAAPVAVIAPHAQPGFAGAMTTTKNPNVGPDGVEGTETADADDPAPALAIARQFGIAGLIDRTKVN